MISKTNEKALEASIERHLTGGVSAVPSPGTPFGDDVPAFQTSKGAGYLRGRSTDFNTEFAIDQAKFWQFLETTQPAELAKLHHKADWKRQVLERLHRKLKKDGIIAVLKKGLDVDNAHLTLFQFRRCLVHFAVDPDEVWMTTKLDGKDTYFLPFNKGQPNGQGKGNPVTRTGTKPPISGRTSSPATALPTSSSTSPRSPRKRTKPPGRSCKRCISRAITSSKWCARSWPI